MMNNRLEGVLESLKVQAVTTHLLPLYDAPPPKAQPSPFELYSYEEPIDYSKVEERMREEIMDRYNQELYHEERKRLKMEAYYLQQAIEIEKSEVQMMRIRVEAQTSKAKLSVPVKRKQRLSGPIIDNPQPEEVEEEKQKMKQTLPKSSKCAIYTNLNIDLTQTLPKLEPESQAKPIPPPLNLQTLPRASTYRRSRPTHSRRRTPTAQTQQPETTERKPSLQAIEQQISFYERAWQDAQSKKQRKLTRHYKAKIAQLLETFWQCATN